MHVNGYAIAKGQCSKQSKFCEPNVNYLFCLFTSSFFSIDLITYECQDASKINMFITLFYYHLSYDGIFIIS
jgi:hypothetical protein